MPDDVVILYCDKRDFGVAVAPQRINESSFGWLSECRDDDGAYVIMIRIYFFANVHAA